MSRWEDELEDRFLAEIESADAEALARLTSEGVAPKALRAKLLANVTLEGRFDHHAARVAELLMLREAQALELLDRIGRADSWRPSPIPRVELFHIEGGPGTENAITGFVRIEAGAGFPEHEHLGDEWVLIIQGSVEDLASGEIHRPGDVARMSPGTTHALSARPGPDLVFLSVVQTGIRIGEQVFGPDDPEL